MLKEVELVVPGPEAQIDDALLNYITRRIVEIFNPRCIILFGSYARGDYGPDSDIDLFIEMETIAKPHQRNLQVRRLFAHQWWPMDVLVYTPEEVLARRNSLVSIVPTIEREGRVLFERGN